MEMSYEQDLQAAIRNMDEQAILDLLLFEYKSFTYKADADEFAWLHGGWRVFWTDRMQTATKDCWIVATSEYAEKAFQSIGMPWHPIDLDPDFPDRNGAEMMSEEDAQRHEYMEAIR